jgi:hypothetical protein
VDDLLGREVLGASAGAVLVVIDDAGAVGLAARRRVLAGENPDFLGNTERVEDETPEGGFVDFLIIKRAPRCQNF